MVKEEIIEQYRANIVFLGTSSAADGKEYSLRVVGTGFVVEGMYIVTATAVYDEMLKSGGVKTGKIQIFAGVLEKEVSNVDAYRTYDVSYLDRDDERGICILLFASKLSIGFYMNDLSQDEDEIQSGVEALMLGFPLVSADKISQSDIFAQQSRVEVVQRDSFGHNENFFVEALATHIGSPVISLNNQRIIGIIVGTAQGFLQQGEMRVGQQACRATPALYVYELIENIQYRMTPSNSYLHDSDLPHPELVEMIDTDWLMELAEEEEQGSIIEEEKEEGIVLPASKKGVLDDDGFESF